MMNYNRIQPWLLVGTFPECADEIEMLHQQAGVTAVLNLQTDEDIEEFSLSGEPPEALYADSRVKLFRLPVQDFDELRLQQQLPECVAALRRLLDQGHTVYLHCTAGVNRSPTVAIAYLHWCLGWELASAVKHVLRCRNCAPRVEAIRLAKWQPPGPPSKTQSSSATKAA